MSTNPPSHRGRPPFPKLTSTSANLDKQNSNRALSSGTSPSRGPPRRQPSAVSSMPPKKRSGPRGGSPPEKRSRPPESTAEINFDRYVHPSNFPPLATAPSLGPWMLLQGPRQSKDERRTDPYRSETRRDSMDRRLLHGASRANSDLAPRQRKSSVDTRSPLSTVMSPLSITHSEAALPESGGSTPIQIAPPAPSMTPRQSHTVVSNIATASLVNYVNSEQHVSRLRQQGETAPPTMANLHAWRTKKKDLAIAELDANKKRLTNVITQAPRATNGTGTEVKDIASPTQTHKDVNAAEVKALQIEVAKLKKDSSAEARERKQWEEETRNAIQEQVSAALQQQMQQAIQTQVRAILDKDITPMIDVRFTEQSKEMSSKTLEYSSKIDEIDASRVTSLSTEVSALQDFKRYIEDEESLERIKEVEINERRSWHLANDALDHLQGEGGLLNRVKNLEKLGSKHEGNANNLNALRGDLALVQQRMALVEKPVTRGPAVEISQIEELISKALDPITQRLDKSEQGIEEKHQQTVQASEHKVELSENRLSKLVEDLEKNIRTDLNNSLSALDARVSAEQNEGTSLSTRVQAWEEDIKTLNTDLNNRLSALDARVSSAEQNQATSLSTRVQAWKEDTKKSNADLNNKLSALDARVSNAEQNQATRVQACEEDIKTLNTDLATAEEDIARCKLDIQGLQEDIPNHLANHLSSKLDPFKAAMDQRLSSMDNKLASQSGEIMQIKHRPAQQQPPPPQVQSPNFPPDRGSPNAGLGSRSSRINSPQPSLSTLEQQFKLLSKNCNDLKIEMQQLQQKYDGELRVQTQEATELRNRLEISIGGFQQLEDRYNNITTDGIVRSMVHQMQQMYPDAPAFLQQLGMLQKDFNILNANIQKLEQAWPAVKRGIAQADLANQKADSQIATNQEFHVALSSLKETCRTLVSREALPQMIMSVTERMDATWHNELQTLGSTLQIKLEDVKSSHAGDYRKLEQKIAEGQQKQTVLQLAQSTLQTDVDNECKERISADDGIWNSLAKTNKELGKAEEVLKYVDDIKEACGKWPQIKLCLQYIQQVTKYINMNLPGGGLDGIDWDSMLLESEGERQ